ncbi:hypothetical protein D3C73_1453520 [compost metagenome]
MPLLIGAPLAAQRLPEGGPHALEGEAELLQLLRSRNRSEREVQILTLNAVRRVDQVAHLRLNPFPKASAVIEGEEREPDEGDGEVH